jgi:integrase/recombinase XerC
MSAERHIRPLRPLTDAIDDFILAKELDDCAPATVVFYRAALGAFLAFAGEVAPGRVDAPLVRRWLAHLRDLGRSGTTRAHYYATLRAMLAHAGRDARWDIRTPRRDTEQPDPFTGAEVERLRRAAAVGQGRGGGWLPIRQRAIVAVLADGGLRRGELCGLALGDYDEGAGKLQVRAETSKSRRSRTVQLGRRAQRDLNAWVAGRYRRPQWPQGRDAPLFVGRHGRAMGVDTVYHLVADLGRRAGVEDAHPHRFRHFCAVECLRAGMPVQEVQLLLGHRSIAQTMAYCKLIESDVSDSKRARSPLDRLRA